ncbi:MAG: hypothetical protein ACPGVO_23285, partial [Spirulinaceae cyanobacterium]
MVLKLPRPQDPPSQRRSRRPAPYRYAPGRRAGAAPAGTVSNRTARSRSTPTGPNPAVKLSHPYPRPAPNRLAPLPSQAQRGGQLVSQRQDTNPALAIHLLREIEEVVVGWQRELKQILVQLQNLYLEGPMINGWLESTETEPSGGSPSPAYAQTARAYATYQGRVSYERPRAAYRLCGRNEKGQLWSKVCPPEQVTAVSMAIA